MGADDPHGKLVLEDPSLIAAIQAGDGGAFERVVRLHGGALLATARRFLRDDNDAREALQDAFLSAFRTCRGFQGTSHIGTWLHRIVVNACLMRLRSRSRGEEVSIDQWLPRFQEDGHHEAVFTDWSPGADALIERDEACAHVRACIDRLPDAYRTVLIMRDMEDMPIAEMAAALEVSPNAVKIRIHRARQALRTLLDPAFIRSATS